MYTFFKVNVLVLQKCTDNNGSYSCATECNEGYNKTIENSGEITCSPIDECSVPDTCDVITEICVDIPGNEGGMIAL